MVEHIWPVSAEATLSGVASSATRSPMKTSSPSLHLPDLVPSSPVNVLAHHTVTGLPK